MPNTEFLIAAGQVPRSVPDAIDALYDRSVLFIAGWTANDRSQYLRASSGVNQYFDHIVSALMRARDDIQSGHRPANAAYVAALGAPSGLMAKPVTLVDQQSVRNVGDGHATLPPGIPQIHASLAETLNKIKHQNESQANFRIDANRHIVVICADKPNKTPDCILELDVQDFCRSCRSAWSLL
jgi:hypothetical protein